MTWITVIGATFGVVGGIFTFFACMGLVMCMTGDDISRYHGFRMFWQAGLVALASFAAYAYLM